MLRPGLSAMSSTDDIGNDSTDFRTSVEDSASDSWEASRATEPIAIIGIGCRLPGGTNSDSKLWDMLSTGRSGQRPLPADRYNMEAFYHPNGDRPGSLNTAGGYFIDGDIRAFENSFSGSTILKPCIVDPQQRKLLEIVFEMFENAGITLREASGSNTGCYVGNFVTDFIAMQFKDPEYLHRYSATGSGTTILANRISHVFNLKGPSFVVDTACSSSLYCLHLACSALQAGECDSAIVAGVNLIQMPEQQLATMKAGVLSETSTCHTFDASADGYGRADGVGALLLKKLSHAIRDGDVIRSVIRGTAVNSNGKTNGITLPSSDGQESVIRKAYQQAGLSPHETDYVECHGTGTAVGDPIEVEALSRVFKRPHGSPLLIGSVKTNLGHSEAASGIASIIKVALALEKGIIPPTIGVSDVNEKIKLDDWNVQIVTENTEWPTDMPYHRSRRTFRRAGVNSFGYGGANSHCILESPEMHTPREYGRPEGVQIATPTVLFPFSASSRTALNHRVDDLAMLDLKSIDIASLSHTLGSRRSHLLVRGYAIATQATLEQNMTSENLNVARPDVTYPKLPFVFVFNGQGAQWPGMGRELMEQFVGFRQTIDKLDACLQALEHAPSWSLRAAFMDPAMSNEINKAYLSQPICTALQIGLVDLFTQWGILQHGVLGHSSGEIAAAYASGYITAEQAIVIAYYRGYVVSESQMNGAMMAVGIGRQKTQANIDSIGLGSVLTAACMNSPQSTTVSGSADAIDTLKSSPDNPGTPARKLKTDGKAYHPSHMSLIGQRYEDLLRSNDVGGQNSHKQIQWISSVTGSEIKGQLGPEYWRQNLESPVLFDGVIESFLKSGPCHFIELGPHSALELPIEQIRAYANIDKTRVRYTSALSRQKNSIDTVLHLMGQVFLHGHDILFDNINSALTSLSVIRNKGASHGRERLLVGLPNYHWNYDEILFNESRMSSEWRHRRYPRHDLLGSRVPGDSGRLASWRNLLNAKDVAWIDGHRLDDTVVFPAAGYIAMATEAITQVSEVREGTEFTVVLRNVKILKALPLPLQDNSLGTEIFTTLQATDSNCSEFHISSYNEDVVTSHATGSIELQYSPIIKLSMTAADTNIDALEPSAPRTWYNRFTKAGLNYLGRFQALSEINCDRNRELMRINARTNVSQELDSINPESTYLVHPVTFDAMLQAGIIASTAGIVTELSAKVPVMIDEVQIRKIRLDTTEMSINATSQPIGLGSINISAVLYNTSGEAFARVDNCRAVSYQSGSQTQDDDDRHPMLRVVWKPDISSLDPSNEDELSQHIDKFISSSSVLEKEDGPDARDFLALIDLLSHKNPALRILNFFQAIDNHLISLLELNAAIKRCKSCIGGSFSADGQLIQHDLASGKRQLSSVSNEVIEAFDVVIAPPVSSFGLDEFRAALDYVNGEGSILCRDGSDDMLQETEFVSLKSRKNKDGTAITLLTRRITSEESVGKPGQDSILVEGDSGQHFNDALVTQLARYTDRPVSRIPFRLLTSSSIRKDAIVLSTVELDNPVVACMNGEQMRQMKVITDNASTIVWITNGGLLNGLKPEFGVVFGLSRALMLEQPSLRFFCVDVECRAHQLQPEKTVNVMLKVVKQASTAETPDFEFMAADGMLHISRFHPDEEMNREFRAKQRRQPVETSLSEARPYQLSIDSPGHLDSLMLRSSEMPQKPPQKGFVEVFVQAVGLTSRDLKAIKGDASCPDSTCSTQYTRVVTRVGPEVNELAAGDLVAVLFPGHFCHLECVPEWACYKLATGDDIQLLAGLPFSLSSALYVVEYSRLQQSESVLIDCNAEYSSSLAVWLSKRHSANIFVLCRPKVEATIIKNYGIPSTRVFDYTSAHSFEQLALEVAKVGGVDVILDFRHGLALDQLNSLSREYGRIVRIGRRNDLSAIAAPTSKSLSVISCNPEILASRETRSDQRLRRGYMTKAVWLAREGIPGLQSLTSVFDASSIKEAFQTLALDSHSGPIVVSFQADHAPVTFLPPRFRSTFSTDKTYLMIGCLGGLGRSFSRWMITRGARKFVFLGRSGIDRAPARRLVEDLQQLGAEVKVVRGDVVSANDVTRAVEAVKGTIGGVIQAAMGLGEALFTAMPQESWQSSLAPKIQGTWNLHNAIRGRDSDLDFFLMTSSVSGSVGTATESNYCSANYFLDTFARYRQGLGLPATAIGLGMISGVGYLHENPEIEAMLLRKGIQAISEDEMLQIVDISLSTQRSSTCDYDIFSGSHVLTGLEATGLKELRAKGFEGVSPVMGDPRASLLAASLDWIDEKTQSKAESGLPSEVAAAMKTGEGVREAVLSAMAKKFSNLVLVREDKLDVTKPIGDIGVDSMLAAEFRSWIFQTFKADVPYLALLATSTTLASLAKFITESISSHD